MARQTELLKGTLDLLILRALEVESRHGLGVAERIEQVTRGAFVVKPGSLFPALHRLEQQGWLAAEWKTSEKGQRAKYYRLTRAGKKQLLAEQSKWERLLKAIRLVMRPTEG